jgi:RNA polymerase sigma-70 factor (ECF subfamily)
MKSEQATDAERWVDRHGDSLYRYALRRLRSPDLAADLVQETFLQALQARDSFAGRSSERTWLIGILRHKIFDHFRKSGREPTVAAGGADESSVESFFDRRGHWRAAPEAWAGEASRALERREFWEVFGHCLSRLPAGVADAFFLREVDGLDGEEVQERLGISPANLWTRLHRARTLLRRCLEIGWFGRRAQAEAYSKDLE